MWWKQSSSNKPRYDIRGKNRYILDSKFQWRHITALLLAVHIPLLLVLSISYYFISQNYDAFMEIAYRYSPELIVHLNREKYFITYLFIISGIGVGLYTFLLGLQMTYRLIGPVYALKRHINNLIRGDWSQPPLKVRKNDDYHDLIDIYNYFYSSLRRQSEWELEQISRCQISAYALESRERKRALVEYKASQLSLEPQDFLKEKEDIHIVKEKTTAS